MHDDCEQPHHCLAVIAYHTSSALTCDDRPYNWHFTNIALDPLEGSNPKTDSSSIPAII